MVKSSKNPPKTVASPPSFESSLEELERLIEHLEQEDVALEEQLKAFEKGVSLSQACLKQLEDIEKKVLLLTEEPSGELNASALPGSSGSFPVDVGGRR